MPGWWLGVLCGVVVALTLATAVAFGAWNAETGPEEVGPEAGFARDMQAHHAQAIEMAFIIRDKTDDEALRAITYDIITTQQQQIGQMFAWLEQWNLSHTSERPPMAGMPGMDHDDGPMPGMASQAEIAELKQLSGARAAELFLRLMINHHRAGIAMSRAIQPMTADSRVAKLASSMASAHQAEIDQMTTLLTHYK